MSSDSDSPSNTKIASGSCGPSGNDTIVQKDTSSCPSGGVWSPAVSAKAVAPDEARSQMQEISLKIYDSSGRIVKSFNLASDLLPLASVVTWDGTDNFGKQVPAGVYFVKLENSTNWASKKIVKLK